MRLNGRLCIVTLNSVVIVIAFNFVSFSTYKIEIEIERFRKTRSRRVNSKNRGISFLRLETFIFEKFLVS